MVEIEKTIENSIYLIRSHKVMLSTDLARLYEVQPKVFIQALKRNKARFPDDFMFRLTIKEASFLRSQIVTLERGKGKYSKYPPYAFTEQGVAMLSSVLNSEKSIKVNIQIIRTFVRLRQIMASNAELAQKIDALEKKYDGQFAVVFEAIRQLIAPIDCADYAREKKNRVHGGTSKRIKKKVMRKMKSSLEEAS